MQVYVEGKRLFVDPGQSIGQGGEAEVYAIGGNRALKIFKQPNHPDYAGLPEDQAGAKSRIETHQRKLPDFPRALPERVIGPEEFATASASGGAIVGYTMRYLKGMEVLFRYAHRPFREAGGITNSQVVDIFRDLHATLMALHGRQLVVGDFNSLNVLVSSRLEAYLIDADSFQFGNYPCPMYTAKFVDPLLCDPKQTSPVLIKPHTVVSDWYAYALMLMQCLLYVGPFEGVYRPKDKHKQVPPDARNLRRITVFEPEVIYPKVATHYRVLPDELLDLFTRIFGKDERGVFPLSLLHDLRWTVCLVCKTEHARPQCPNCHQASPAAIKSVITVRGTVTAERIFRTAGIILTAAMQSRGLAWLTHERGRFLREDGSLIFSGSLTPGMQYRMSGDETLVGVNGALSVWAKNGSPAAAPGGALRVPVDQCGTRTLFDATEKHRFLVRGGQLLVTGQYGEEAIGSVLSGQTLFWTGAEFGFGLYRAGNLSVSFTFTGKARSLNDNVKLPPLRGQLIDAGAVFAKDRCWFFVAMNTSGVIRNHCFLLRQNGTVEGQAVVTSGDGSWLSHLPLGAAAVGDKLLVPTDDGIVQMACQAGTISEAKRFPDTEPFVDSQSRLFVGKDGLYVVSTNEIHKLTIA
jgi:serine/threonine protein kinase